MGQGVLGGEVNRPHINLDRSIELQFVVKDERWKAWLDANNIAPMLCFHLEPLNEALTRWEAECYVQDEKGRATYVHEDGQWMPKLATKTEIIETTPGRPEWLEK